MAKFRRRSRRTFRRKRRPCDIVPLSLCREGFEIPLDDEDDPDLGTCAKPYQVAFPLADGGALDTILQASALANVGSTEAYYDAQGVSRGLSVLGLEFALHLFLTWSPEAMAASLPLLTSFTVQWAIMVEEMTSGPPLRGPLNLPNLFSRDEKDLTGKLLYRWTDELPFVALPTSQGAPSLVQSTNYGQSIVLQSDPNQTGHDIDIQGTLASHTGLRRHRVRSRRRLDENHALFLMLNITTGVLAGSVSSTAQLGLNCMGLMKLRGR